MIVRHYVVILVLSFVVNFLLVFATAHAYQIEIPPYYGLNIKFLGSVSESYNTNITFAAGEEDRVDDFVTNLSGGLNIEFEGRKRKMGLTGHVNRRYRAENFNSLNPSEDLNIYYQDELSEESSIFLNNSFRHSHVPAAFGDSSVIEECEKLRAEAGIEAVRRDPRCADINEEFGRFKGNFESYDNDFNINYGRDIRQYMTINMNYGNSLRSSSREDVNDSILHRIGFSTDYDLSPTTRFNMAYSFATRNFENSGDISTHTPSIGIRKYLTKRLILIGGIGITISTLSDNETSIGRNVQASLTHEISDETHESISFRRTDSINADKEDVFRNWQANWEITSQLLEDLTTRLSIFYGEGDFVSTGITDRLFVANINLYYKIWEHKSGANIRWGMGYIYSNLNSTDQNRGYSRSSINFGLTAGI